MKCYFILAMVLLALAGCGGGGGGSSSGVAAECRAENNPGLPDLDGDGIVNGCDDDMDEDGIANAADNCPATANPDQEDGNGDGIGTACDGDEDGVLNRDDNCETIFNSDQLDSDENDIGDRCDVTFDTSSFNFSSPLDLSETEGHTYRPKAAVDSEDNIYVVWHDNSNVELGSEVWFTKLAASGLAESADIDLSNSPAIAVNPQIEVGPDDVIHVVYQDNIGGVSDIYYTRSSDGGQNFTEPVNVSNLSEGSVDPDISVAASGEIYIAWSGGSQLYLIASSDGGDSFGSPATIAVPASVEPALEAAAPGVVHLTWSQPAFDTDDRSVVKYARSDDGGGSFAVELQLQSGTQPKFRPDFAVDGDDIYIAWDEEVEGVPDIFLAISRDGGSTFSSPKNISQNSPVSLLAVLELAPSGQLYLAWTDTFAGNYETVFSYSTDRGATFTPPLNFAPSAEGSLVVDMAVDSTDAAIIVWDDNRFGAFDAVLSYGNIGLPVIIDTSVLPDFYHPASDGNLVFTAMFSEELQWDLTVLDSAGRIVHNQRGNGVSLSQFWNGHDLDDAPLDDGDYYYTLTGVTRSSGANAIQAGGVIRVSSLDDAGSAAEISEFGADQLVFSPNDDGRDEETLIYANFNRSLSWQLEIYSPEQVLLHTETGTGPSAQYLWRGRDDSDGTPLAEGDYSVELTANDSEGAQVSGSLSIEIDLTKPLLDDISIGAVNLSSDTPAEIAVTISEGTVVTVYIYESDSGALVNELSRQSYSDAGRVAVTWNGSPGGGESTGVKVNPGDYAVKIWVRDYGANRANPYPVTGIVSVTE